MIKNRYKVRMIADSAIFAAISVVLYYFVKFPLPFFPSWLEVNFSMLPIIIATVAYGVKPGIVIVILRFLLKLPASHTMYVGEAADLVLGLGVVVAIALVLHCLKKMEKTKAMILALFAGLVVWVIVAMLANWLVLLPFYMKLFGLTAESIVTALSMIPGVTEANYMTCYLIYAVVPFNLLLGLVVMAITFGVWRGLYWRLPAQNAPENMKD